MDELVAAAVSAAIGALAKVAKGPAMAAGQKVWDWLKGELGEDEADTVAAVEQAPEKASAPAKISGLLLDLFDRDPDAAEKLRQLIEQAGGIQAVTLTANVTGDGNKVAQVSGSGNKTRIG